jgi:hypothetical protein
VLHCRFLVVFTPAEAAAAAAAGFSVTNCQIG